MAAAFAEGRVFIVGGGPAGAATAITLAERGFKPVVLETLSQPAFKVGECLPPSARPVLARLGLAERLPSDGHLPSYGNRSVWGAPVPSERDFIFGTGGHGWQLDRARFEAALADRAREVGADWRSGSRLLKCTREDGCWSLIVRTASGEETFEADFVVDSTGRASRVALGLGARRIRYDGLIGAALLLKSQTGGIRDSLTLVEAVASGWWYSARLPGDKLMAVYLTDSDLLNRRAIKTDGWLALLEETGHTIRRVRDGNYRPLAEPRILAANASRLDSVVGENWLAVGDAATAYDPLSSYGISSALGSGFYAASAIADYFAGDPHALSSYSQMINQAYEQYLIMHREHYALERRWPDEPFWRRRHDARRLRTQTKRA